MANTTTVLFEGDKAAAAALKGVALNQLNILRSAMAFQDLLQDKRTLTYEDGTVIRCESVFGKDTVIVYVPEIIPEKEVTPELCRKGKPASYKFLISYWATRTELVRFIVVTTGSEITEVIKLPTSDIPVGWHPFGDVYHNGGDYYCFKGGRKSTDGFLFDIELGVYLLPTYANNGIVYYADVSEGYNSKWYDINSDTYGEVSAVTYYTNGIAGDRGQGFAEAYTIDKNELKLYTISSEWGSETGSYSISFPVSGINFEQHTYSAGSSQVYESYYDEDYFHSGYILVDQCTVNDYNTFQLWKESAASFTAEGLNVTADIVCPAVNLHSTYGYGEFTQYTRGNTYGRGTIGIYSVWDSQILERDYVIIQVPDGGKGSEHTYSFCTIGEYGNVLGDEALLNTLNYGRIHEIKESITEVTPDTATAWSSYSASWHNGDNTRQCSISASNSCNPIGLGSIATALSYANPGIGNSDNIATSTVHHWPQANLTKIVSDGDSLVATQAFFGDEFLRLWGTIQEGVQVTYSGQGAGLVAQALAGENITNFISVRTLIYTGE